MHSHVYVGACMYTKETLRVCHHVHYSTLPYVVCYLPTCLPEYLLTYILVLIFKVRCVICIPTDMT